MRTAQGWFLVVSPWPLTEAALRTTTRRGFGCVDEAAAAGAAAALRRSMPEAWEHVFPATVPMGERGAPPS
eukprot:CAMPEP_0179142688 /NCGR_PEP_ID=MMETSP0796-20121207/68553_1 /TAXON_ID=73915 /ORGANISM="Pyrodinium bahamense, Strain pbaha01" /LENGTH=70 /DNA_ID=CAMNT_0020842595 /DNA_START=114 /DNA_END=324 /DNA_ORIENTATION=+